MKTLALTLAAGFAMARLLSAQTNDASLTTVKPLPPLDFLIQKAVTRAVTQEDTNDDLFAMSYQYNRTRIWEYRNSSGELKSREEKDTVENKPQRMAAKAARLGIVKQPIPPPPPAKAQLLSDTHSNIQGKALKVKDYSITDLVSRFHIQLVRRELLNGRPSLVVDFQPASDDLPVHTFADKFINKAAGRVWVDEEDYALAQAQLHLTEPVTVLGGLVGVLRKFTYEFTRVRTPEGLWFARNMDWHLEGREVVINRIVDYHEQKLNEQKIVTTANAR